jgi:hypothetical protein
VVAQAQQYQSPRQRDADERMDKAQDAQRQLDAKSSQYQQLVATKLGEAGAHMGNAKLSGAQQAASPSHAVTSVPAGSYQKTFDALSARRYRLVWFDAFTNGPHLFYNTVWTGGNQLAWASWNMLTGDQYQQQFNQMTSQGFRLAHIHCYAVNNQLYYAPVFQREQWPAWTAYHGVDGGEHQRRFNSLTSQGYRLVDLSVAFLGGRTYFAALYDKASVGGWVAKAELPLTQYQAEFDSAARSRLFLAYMSVYDRGGQPFFSAVWDARPYRNHQARHNLTGAGYTAAHLQWTKAGLPVRLVSGYVNAGVANYAAVWAT